jgi:hypothetical protein
MEPKVPRRGKYLQIRTTVAERALLAERAKERGQTVSDMIREAVGLDSPLVPEVPRSRRSSGGSIEVAATATGQGGGTYHYALTTPGGVEIPRAPESPAPEPRAGFSCPKCNWSTIVPGLGCPEHG